MKPKAFQTFVDLDTTTIVCPCGARACNDTVDLSEFMKTHMEHTNGCVDETITDDGARCLVENTPRTRTYSVLQDWLKTSARLGLPDPGEWSDMPH